MYYRMTWRPWSAVAWLLRRDKRRESFLSFFGPLSLLFLLTFWALGLILSFGLLQYGCGSAVEASGRTSNFLVDLYLSATTFFTLGIGDVTPHSEAARALTAAEAREGLGFPGALVGHLPGVLLLFAPLRGHLFLLATPDS